MTAVDNEYTQGVKKDLKKLGIKAKVEPKYTPNSDGWTHFSLKIIFKCQQDLNYYLLAGDETWIRTWIKLKVEENI